MRRLLRGIKRHLAAWLNTAVTIRQTLPLYAMIVVAGMAGFWQVEQLNDQRVDDLRRQSHEIDVRQCLGKVAARESLRGAFDTVFDLFPADEPLVAQAREQLDERYPAFDPDTCGTIPSTFDEGDDG